MKGGLPMFGEILRVLRKSSGLTQVRLGQLTGIADNYISELESGVAGNPSLQTIKKLAEALGIQESILMAELSTEWETMDNDEPDREAINSIGLPAEDASESESSEDDTIDDSGEPGELDRAEAERKQAGHIYKGFRELRRGDPDGRVYVDDLWVLVDGHRLPLRSYLLSTGIEWGYLGSGPLALAYDLLVHEFGESLAGYHYKAFAYDFVCHLPAPFRMRQVPGFHLEWTLTSSEIRHWLEKQPRPPSIEVHLNPHAWRVQEDGRICATVYEQFLLDRRFVFELELDDDEYKKGRWKINRRRIYEEQLLPLDIGLLAWHYVRDVEGRDTSASIYWSTEP